MATKEEIMEKALQAAADANGGYIDAKIVRIVTSAINVCLAEISDIKMAVNKLLLGEE